MHCTYLPTVCSNCHSATHVRGRSLLDIQYVCVVVDVGVVSCIVTAMYCVCSGCEMGGSY